MNMIAAAVKLLSELLTTLLSWISDAIAWLRKPGSILKVVCAVLAVGFALAALSSYRQGQRVIVVTRQVKQCIADQVAAAEAAQLRAAELAGNVADKDAALATIAAKLQAEADKLEQLRARNEALLAEADAARAQADASANAFKQQYDRRPAECTAALKAMAAACPTLGGY
ncbi:MULTISPECIES: hypothetical protein [unclassified Xanthomonas]|uniref:hypothetical protein n=1 Tax=unclassified Xanthomonas TaxID=2643310 RepID=UPI002A7FB6E8|nr:MULTISPECIES: hypothetical protein [unclassified Xanthomonas]MDY4296828.1 hypothetical protein [Xanthomonas sp. LF02-5]MDY4358413.1 hypothetical protein [Xanthomonas sp. LF04-12]